MLDVYFKEDVTQGIVAVAVAMLSAAVAHGNGNVEYCRGVIDTTRAQALNYGVWDDVRDELELEGGKRLLELKSWESIKSSYKIR